MQTFGAFWLQQLSARAPGVLGECAAACQVPLLHCLASFQQAQHERQPTSTIPLQQPQQQQPLTHQQQWQQQQHQLHAFRHYKAPARAAARRQRPDAAADSDSDSDLGGYTPVHRGSRQQQQQQRRVQPQQRPQQPQLSLRLQPRQQELLDEQEHTQEVQHKWRQQWRQQQQEQQLLQRQQYMPRGERGGSRQRGDTEVDASSNDRGSSRTGGRGSQSHEPYRQQQHQQQQGQQGQAPGWLPAAGPSKPAIDAYAITQAISAAGSLQELQKLLNKHKDTLQQVHVCAAYKAVVRLAVGLRGKPAPSSSTAAAPDSSRPSSSSGSVSTDPSGGSAAGGSGSSAAQAPVDGSIALDILRQLSSRMQQQIRVARPWDLAQAAWACSKLQFRDDRLLQAVAQQAQRKAAILTPQDISQLASAYARLSYPHPQLLQLLNSQAVAKAQGFAPWVLVHTAWALHTGGQDVLGLLRVAVPLLRGRLQELKELDVSSLLWLVAGHALHDEELLTAAATQLAAIIDTYSPPSVANALMGCAVLGFSTPPLLTAARAAALAGLQQQRYRPRQVAHAVFALARLQACDQALLDATAAAFGREAQAYSPPLLSMLVWVCVLARQRLPEGFVQQLVHCSRQKLEGFSGDQMASLLRGLLAMPAQQDSQTALLLSEAQALLPQKLPGVNTTALTELIRSLGQCLLQQQQHQQHAAQASAAPCDSLQPGQQDSGSGAVGDLSTHRDGSSSSSAEGVQQQRVLEGMLQDGVAEWSAAGRLGQLTHWQAVSVEGVLEHCGLHTLAAVAKQASEDIRAAAAGQQSAGEVADGTDGSVPVAGGRQAAGSAAGTWVDSFVASTQ